MKPLLLLWLGPGSCCSSLHSPSPPALLSHPDRSNASSPLSISGFCLHPSFSLFVLFCLLFLQLNDASALWHRHLRAADRARLLQRTKWHRSVGLKPDVGLNPNMDIAAAPGSAWGMAKPDVYGEREDPIPTIGVLLALSSAGGVVKQRLGGRRAKLWQRCGAWRIWDVCVGQRPKEHKMAALGPTALGWFLWAFCRTAKFQYLGCFVGW